MTTDDGPGEEGDLWRVRLLGEVAGCGWVEEESEEESVLQISLCSHKWKDPLCVSKRSMKGASVRPDETNLCSFWMKRSLVDLRAAVAEANMAQSDFCQL